MRKGTDRIASQEPDTRAMEQTDQYASLEVRAARIHRSKGQANEHFKYKDDDR